MSGPAPETERERQLRQLASRFLSWPDPEGPVTTDLIPVGYSSIELSSGSWGAWFAVGPANWSMLS